MARNGNLLCVVCRAHDAAWRCACAAVPLCRTPSCLGVHLAAASATPHLLTPYGNEALLPHEEAKRSLSVYDKAVETAKFVEEERKWLKEKQRKIYEKIDIEVNRLCEIIQNAGENAKLKIAQETESALIFLQNLHKDLLIPSQSSHLIHLKLHIGPVPSTDFFTFSLHSINPRKSIYRNLNRSGKWNCAGVNIDAVTIQPSKPIYLVGVMFGEPVSSNMEVRELQVLDGDSTRSKVRYSHPEGVRIRPGSRETEIEFTTPVYMSPEKKYTVKVVLAGGLITSGSTKSTRVQDGLEVKLFNTNFSEGDISNNSGPETSIFFGFLYR